MKRLLSIEIKYARRERKLLSDLVGRLEIFNLQLIKRGG